MALLSDDANSIDALYATSLGFQITDAVFASLVERAAVELPRVKGVTYPPTRVTLDLQGEYLHMVQSNGSSTIAARTQMVSVLTPGAVEVDAKRLRRYASRCNGDITAQVNGGNLSLKTATQRFSLQASIWPLPVPTWPDNEEVLIPAGGLRDVIARMLHVLEPTSPTSQVFQIDEGVVAAKRGRLYAQEYVEGLSSLSGGLDARSARLILQGLRGTDQDLQVALAVDEDHMYLRVGGGLLKLPFAPGAVEPLGESVLSKVADNDMKMSVDTAELRRAVEDVMAPVTHDVDQATLKFSLSANKLTLSCSQDGALADSVVQVWWPHDEELVLDFRAAELLAVLRATKSVTWDLRLAATSIEKPSTLLAVEGEHGRQVLQQA